MFKELLIVAALAAGLVSTQASATFISTDWKVDGDKRATLDTVSGLEWLKLRTTKDESMQDVLAQLDTKYAGWRLPTNDEITTMMKKAFNNLNLEFGYWSEATGYYRAGGSRFFTNLIGGSYYHGQNFYGGLYFDENGILRLTGVEVRTADLYTTVIGLANNNYYQINQSLSPYSTHVSGVFLVSDGGTTLSSLNDPKLNINNPNAPINTADVSAPAGLISTGALMLMLGFRRKTKGIVDV